MGTWASRVRLRVEGLGSKAWSLASRALLPCIPARGHNLIFSKGSCKD